MYVELCYIIIFKFVPEDLLNAERNSHNLELSGVLRKQSQVKSVSNEITNSDGSWDNVVGVMTRLLGGGRKNEGVISSRGKDSSLQVTQTGLRPRWTPFGLESILDT